MTDNTLRAFVEKASGLADCFFNPDGQMLAHFIAERLDHKITLIASTMSGPDEERMFRLGMPLKLRHEGFVRWCFFTEAWTAPSAGSGPGQEGYIFPADRPDRMEVVIFAAEEAATGEKVAASRQISRGPDGRGKLLPLVFAQESVGFVVDDKPPDPTDDHAAERSCRPEPSSK